MTQSASRPFPRLTAETGRKTAHAPEADSAIRDHQQAVAHYISDMILELRNMAKSVKLAKVMVPLEFAYYEAFTAANEVAVPPGEAERLRRLSQAAQRSDGPAKGEDTAF